VSLSRNASAYLAMDEPYVDDGRPFAADAELCWCLSVSVVKTEGVDRCDLNRREKVEVAAAAVEARATAAAWKSSGPSPLSSARMRRCRDSSASSMIRLTPISWTG